jgi:hypothetical protein
VKWLQTAWMLLRDVGLTGFGIWVIWKQVEAVSPNDALLVVALGCLAPAARSAVAAILSGPGPLSESLPPQEEQPSHSSPPGGGTGE